MARRHDNDYPLWQGPCAQGPLGGITQSMLGRFFSCRERFRLKYVCGLEPHDKWNHRLGYGLMWHVCEEALAGTEKVIVPSSSALPWESALLSYTRDQLLKYPLQRDEIIKWSNVCMVQFPEYVHHWAQHPDVLNRQPLLQETVFDVSYALPSGRVVRLRGRWDSVDLIDGGVYLQENKTKGNVDKLQIERQLKFDLQTMLYLVALEQERTQEEETGALSNLVTSPLLGVRYNVIRRPLSGGVGTIRPHKATKAKPAETDEEFYERLRADYLSDDPDYWFFRIRCEVSAQDIEVFRRTCLDPLLEELCCWYDLVTGKHWHGDTRCCPPLHYRTPFGLYNSLEDDGATEYDACLESGTEAGLRRVEKLFTELK